MHRQATGRQILQGSLIAAMHPRRTALAIWTASILGSQAHKHCDTFLRRNELLNLFMIPQHVEMQAVLPDNDDERALLKLISHEPCHVDDLIRDSGLATTIISSKGVPYMKPAKNVDEYIAQAPKEAQEKLQELRATIRTTAPGAEERIS